MEDKMQNCDGCHKTLTIDQFGVKQNGGFYSRCRECTAKRRVKKLSLVESHTDLVEEWYYEKNLKGPEEYTRGSHTKVWWICNKNPCGCHVWQTAIYHRTGKKHGCPYCSNQKVCEHSNFAAKFPELVKEWDYAKNQKRPEEFAPSSGKKVWWICKENPCGCHQWQATINHRTGTSKRGCPYCSNQKVCEHSSLAAKFPELLEEWDYEKNQKDPEEFAPSSHAKVWWLCKENPCGCHKWQTMIYSRTGTSKRGCPYCSNQKICEHSNLSAKFPELAEEWDFEKNARKPKEFAPFSHKKVWWVCKENPCGCHRWQAAIYHRTGNERGCPYCSNNKFCSHSNLSIKFPELLEEWDYEKNQKDPENYPPFSNKKVWWLCKDKKCRFSWETKICNRTTMLCKTGCPRCNISKGEKAISDFLKVHDISFEVERSFDGCIHLRKLSFDVYVPKYNMLIEYDGIQHFIPVECFKSGGGFEGRKKRDGIKTMFTAKSQFSLLRISYLELEHINDILTEVLLHRYEALIIPKFIYNVLDVLSTDDTNGKIVLDTYKKHAQLYEENSH